MSTSTDRVAITSIASWCARNADVLGQAARLLETLDDEQYAAKHPQVEATSVGEHVRHCVDFFHCFLEGLARGAVDYDGRARDRRLETERTLALAELGALCERLGALRGQFTAAQVESRSLSVKLDAPEGGDGAWAASSVVRELQFLASHTVHHFTVIALLLRLDGVRVDPDFGVAPSTLHHRRSARSRDG